MQHESFHVCEEWLTTTVRLENLLSKVFQTVECRLQQVDPIQCRDIECIDHRHLATNSVGLHVQLVAAIQSSLLKRMCLFALREAGEESGLS
jgi:hypothetical protein